MKIFTTARESLQLPQLEPCNLKAPFFLNGSFHQSETYAGYKDYKECKKLAIFNLIFRCVLASL